MAKKSMIAREHKRERTVEKYRKKQLGAEGGYRRPLQIT